ncbi:MAG: cobalamin biosynthesis protein [Chloroflexota bacterium]
MKHAAIALNPRGAEVARRLRGCLPGTDVFLPTNLAAEMPELEATPFGNLRELAGPLFARCGRGPEFIEGGMVFIMPVGIVVRMIAPLAKDKHTDPAVVVVDEGCHFAISLLSGHEGGANRLALKVANATGAEPVITTAAEVAKRTVVGVGARRGIGIEAVRQAIEAALQQAGRPLAGVRWVATLEEKGGEPGIVAACSSLGLDLRTFSKARIARFQGEYHRSAFVREKIGVEGVCEPCVLLSGREMKLLLPKTAFAGVTVAVGEESSI